MQNTGKELKDYFNEQIKIIKNIVKTEKNMRHLYHVQAYQII